MSVFATNYYIAQIYGLVTSGTPYLALYTATPTVAGGGTEVSGGSYARKAVTFGSVSSGSVSNTIAISFTGVPAANITHWGIKDALTAGNLFLFGALNNSVVTISGDEVTFPIGNLQINLVGS